MAFYLAQAAIGQPCSPSDISQGRYVEVAFFQNASYCALGPVLFARGLATRLDCCSTNLCNQISSQVTIAPAVNSTLQCYYGSDANVQLKTVLSARYNEYLDRLVTGDRKSVV